MGPGSTSYRKGVSPMLFYTDCKTNRRPEAQHRERPNLLAALAVLAACVSAREALATCFRLPTGVNSARGADLLRSHPVRAR